jgi:hypothetical protein
MSFRSRAGVRHRQGGLLYIAVTLLGVAGFVGALVASAYFPQWATPLRIVALGWFVCLGGLRIALFWKR